MKRTATVVLLVLAALLITPVMPASAGGGCHDATFRDEATTQVKAFGACFSPAVARVAVGETVTWFADDAQTHTITGPNGYMVDAKVRGGDTVSETFREPGVFPYACVLHPGMVGVVVVGDGGADAAAAPAPPPADAEPPAAEPSVAAPVGLLVTLLVAGVGLAAWQRARRRTPVPTPGSAMFPS